MANVDNPHGLVCIGNETGGPNRIEEFNTAVGNGTAIFINDVVAQAGTSASANGPEEVAGGGTPGTTTPTGVSLTYRAASTTTAVLVNVNPNAIYEAQVNGTGILVAALGLNANIEYNAGSATTKISGHEIDGGTEATTATLDVKILGVYRNPVNSFANTGFERLEIKFNNHRRNNLVAGV